MRHVLRLLAVLLVLCVVPGQAAELTGAERKLSAVWKPADRRVLEGLTEVFALADVNIDEEGLAQDLGLDLLAQLELRLRMVGLTVLTEQEAMQRVERTNVMPPNLILTVWAAESPVRQPIS